MSLLAAVVSGGLLGVRHSLEADHVAAIAVLVDDERPHDAGWIGASWAVGHSVPIVALGLLFLWVGVAIPDGVTALFELLAGAILVFLGLRTLSSLVDVTEHVHGHGAHRHLAVGPVSLGLDHSHREGESFLVGIVHGLAGSGALVVVLVSAAPTTAAGLSFLAAFTLVTVVTMGVLSTLWGRVLSTDASRLLQGIAGVVSAVVGGALVVSELSGVALLDALPLLVALA